MNVKLSEINANNMESMVHCEECKNELCALKQHMRYNLGIEDPFCQLGEKKED